MSNLVSACPESTGAEYGAGVNARWKGWETCTAAHELKKNRQIKRWPQVVSRVLGEYMLQGHG